MPKKQMGRSPLGKVPTRKDLYTPDDNRFALSMRECAGKLRVSERTIWALINSGKLRAFHVGRRVRVLWIELVRFAESGGAE